MKCLKPEARSPQSVAFESRDQAMRQAVEAYGRARAYEISLWLGNVRPELKGDAFLAEAMRVEQQVQEAQRLIFLIANSPVAPQSAPRVPRPVSLDEVRA